jgi:DNA adenine methylase
MNYQKCPWPYYGGKSKAAPTVWTALGDVDHYVEPFAGSMAVLLNRPHQANRPYHSETVNDADGLLVNAWRSIQLHPDATADAASNPVTEADLHARHLALVRWREERQLEHLMGDPAWCDPVMGGWWIWGIACWIGSGWCAGTGPWTADETGRLFKQERNPDRATPTGNRG